MEGGDGGEEIEGLGSNGRNGREGGSGGTERRDTCLLLAPVLGWGGWVLGNETQTMTVITSSQISKTSSKAFSLYT